MFEMPKAIIIYFSENENSTENKAINTPSVDSCESYN